MSDQRSTAEKWKGRTFVLAVSCGAAILLVASVALFLPMMSDRALEAAKLLGINGSWWLYAAMVASGIALGYSAKRVLQDQIFARLSAIKAAGPDDPDKK